MSEHRVMYVMGVSGSGKTTVGQQLADRLGYAFYDGDDFHPQSNIQKMTRKQPLTDEDRVGWLSHINAHAREQSLRQGVVYACSALKKTYRTILSQGLTDVQWVHLSGTFELIAGRLSLRSGHFMPPELLKSQFEALEPPAGVIEVHIDQPVDEMVEQIVAQLSLTK